MPDQPASSITQLHAQRRALLDQIEHLGPFRRGSITEQFVEAIRQDGSKVRRGPYVLYSCKDKGGRTVSRRLKARMMRHPPWFASSACANRQII